MYKLCKTEQSALRQRQLEEGLLTAMKTRRYEEITISDLCDQMCVPRKSFYRYFSSKDGCLHALVDHTLLEFEQLTGLFASTDTMEQVLQAFEMFFEYWYQRSQLLDALARSGFSGLLVQRAVSKALSEHVIPSHLLPEDLHSVHRHALSFSIYGLMSMVLTWHHEGFRQNIREMASIATQIISHPLLEIPDQN